MLWFQLGAIDSRETVILVEYDYLGALLEGLMNFRKDGKLGYMDCSGTVVIPPTYFTLCRFSDGLLPPRRQKEEIWLYR